MKKQGLQFYVACLIFGVLSLFLIFVLFSFVKKNLFDERLHANNAVTDSMDWQVQYPFEEDSNEQSTPSPQPSSSPYSAYTNLMAKVNMAAQNYLETIPYRSEIVSASVQYDSLIGYQFDTQFSSNSIVIRLNNGYLTSPSIAATESNMNRAASSTRDFKAYLDAEGIPFLYCTVGSVVCPTDKQLPDGIEDFSNENNDLFLAKLEEEDVDYVDFRQEIIDAGLDWYGSYYKTDHHWTVEAQLWAAGVLAKKLNEEYGFSFDLNLFQPSSYERITNDQFWLGSRGRLAGTGELESFTLMLPSFPTDCTLYHPATDAAVSGTYSQTVFPVQPLEQIAAYSKEDHYLKEDAYDACTRFFGPGGVVQLINRLDTNNSEKKILFINDSMAMYLIPFLALDLSQADGIRASDFNGSIRSYVKQTQPDMVIVIYGNSLYLGDWNSHTHPFDFR